MALHLWVSMDALVANSSSRALLAFSHSSAASAGGSDAPGSSGHGYGRDGGGDPPRDSSAILALTWDEVSTS